MLSLIGIRHPSVDHLIIVMAVSVTGLLILIGLLQRYRARPKLDHLLAAYKRLCRRTGKVTRERRAAEGPHEYLIAICTARPDLAAELQPLFDMYIRLRYDGVNDQQLKRAFLAAVYNFRPKMA